ncbi:restriction endonuclease subunit S [Streptococcus sanguinis]
MNHHLEQMAISIFKEEFSKKEVTNKLGDFFPVITGKKDANIAKGGEYPFFSCSQNISYTDNYSFDARAILLAGNGDFNVKIFNGKFEAYQRTYVLIPNNDEHFGYLYYAIKYFLNDITSGHRGSVIKFITKGQIEHFNIFMTSNKEKLFLFNSFVENIANNNKEIDKLSNIRDTLLPKLLSDEISVNQATK